MPASEISQQKPPDRINKPAEEGGDVKHVVETGLPPGIAVDDVIDPGSQPPEDRIQRPQTRDCS
jgi:hypothetical protein